MLAIRESSWRPARGDGGGIRVGLRRPPPRAPMTPARGRIGYRTRRVGGVDFSVFMKNATNANWSQQTWGSANVIKKL